MKFLIPDMSCGHCVATIENALKTADPTATFRIDLDGRTAEKDTTVTYDSLTQVLTASGYPCTDIEDSQ